MQKTFQQDVINRKVIKNTGQLPMYLIENHHEGIVSREKYNAVQAEMARRKAAKSPSKRASTGLAAYTSRYALSDRLVCGECGTLYRRCTWTRPDGKRVVWRCVSRLDYGKKYCHSSPTLDEAPLQQAIIAALNTVLPDLDGRIRQITEALEAEVIPFPGSGMSLGDIDRRLAELEAQFQKLLERAADDPIAYGDQFKEILDEQTTLKELRASILAENKEHAEADRRIRDAAGMLENAVPHIAEWDESAIRQLVAQVKVLSKNEISVTLKSGIEIRQGISDYPDMTGFSPRNVRRMRNFWQLYSSMPELLGEALCLNWTQNVVIMEAELTAEEHCWYIRQATARNLSKSELLRMIEDFAHLESVLDEKVDVWYNEGNDEISERTQYEEDPVYLSWQYLPQPHGRVRDEGLGKKGGTGIAISYRISGYQSGGNRQPSLSSGTAQAGRAWDLLRRPCRTATDKSGLRRIRSPDRHGPGQPPGYVPYLRRRLCRQDVPPDGPHQSSRQCGGPMVH